MALQLTFSFAKKQPGVPVLELSTSGHLGSSELVSIHWAFLILCKLNFSMGWGKVFGNILEPQMLSKEEGHSGVMLFVYKSLVGFPGDDSVAASVASDLGLIRDGRAVESGMGPYEGVVPCHWGCEGGVGCSGV